MTRFLALSGHRFEIDLHRSRYRHVPRRGIRGLLFRLRHPVLAIAANKALGPVNPPTERDAALVFAALVHGAVAWFVAAHS